MNDNIRLFILNNLLDPAFIPQVSREHMDIMMHKPGRMMMRQTHNRICTNGGYVTQ
jgi:hypothetical protein